jgi:23S rRNA U2552 (ribose-2'-O)-methylase RlmE/FtsJ
MSFFLLQKKDYNNTMHNHIHGEKLCKDNDENQTIINKTLYKYLSIIKEQIDNRLEQWDKLKKNTNPYEYIHTLIPNTKQSVSTVKPISRSFFKMIEICNTLTLLDELQLDQINSFHLAEGPGGFIEALVYMRKNTNDKYYGMTLIDDNNHNVPGWKKSRHFLSNNPNVIIETGIEKNGDLTKAENLKYCFNKYQGQMNIITGDGGFDFSSQYPQQEQVSTKLIFCQTAFAISMQKLGGTFILKMYDTFTQFSVDILYLLSNLYESVYIIKPNTSRFANSEKYIVCKNFRCENIKEYVTIFYTILSNLEKKDNSINSNIFGSLFDIKIPYIFTNKLEEINAILGQQQIDTIVSTIYLIDNNNKNDKLEHIKKKNIQKCINWCIKHNIPYNNIQNIYTNNNIFLMNNSLHYKK